MRKYDDVDDINFDCPHELPIKHDATHRVMLPEDMPAPKPPDVSHCQHAKVTHACYNCVICWRPEPHEMKVPVEDCTPQCPHVTPREGT